MRFFAQKHEESTRPQLKMAIQNRIVYLSSTRTHKEHQSSSSSSSSSSSNNTEVSSSSSASSTAAGSTSEEPPVASTSTACPPPPFAPAATLRGSLTFTLTQPRCFKALRVNLTGTLRVNYPAGQLSKTTNLSHDADLLYSHSPSFPAGTHTLEFAILLPQRISPSFDCAQGSQSYTLRAYAEDHSGSPWYSSTRDIELVAAASEDQQDCLVDIVSYNEAVGPFAARLVSEHPTVGSLLHLYLHLPSPTVGVTLLHVALSIIQKAHLKSSDRRTTLMNTAILSKEEVLLRTWNTPKGFQDALADPGHTKGLRPWIVGDEVELERQLRLPSHRHYSPSTPKGIRQNLRISHALQIKIRYRQPDGRIKELQITRDFQLLSCKCLADTVVAPPYSVTDPAPKSRRTRQQEVCACTSKIEHSTLMANLKDRPAAPPDGIEEKNTSLRRRGIM